MKIIIVGCGRNGSGLAQTMSKSGHDVTVVDSNAAAFARLGPEFNGKAVEGVGFDKDVLAQAGIELADGLAAFTSSDESNAVIARMAREIYRVPKVIARLYDMQKAEIYKKLGIQTLSSTMWGIRRAAEILSYSTLDTVFSFGSGDVELVKAEIPPLMAGRRLSDGTLAGDVHITAIEREGKTLLPMNGMVFKQGDILYAAASKYAAGQLKKLLGLGGEKEI